MSATVVLFTATTSSPQIKAAMCESNSMVRVVAGRLLVNLVLALAGQQTTTINLTNRSTDEGDASDSLSSASSWPAESVAEGEEDPVESDDNQSVVPGDDDTMTCADDLMSTKSMPRSGPFAYQVCLWLY